MIPDFTADGQLPPGVHLATFDEFKERFRVFQGSDQRLRVFESFEQFVNEIRKTTFVRRLIVGGSFVSANPSPNDFDCVLVLDPACEGASLRPFEYNVTSKRMIRRLYRVDAVIAFEGTVLAEKSLAFFQLTREHQPRGVIEVIL